MSWLLLQTFNGKICEKFNSGGKVSSLAYAKIQGKSVLAACMQNLSCIVDEEQFLPEDFLHYDEGQDSDDQSWLQEENNSSIWNITESDSDCSFTENPW